VYELLKKKKEQSPISCSIKRVGIAPKINFLFFFTFVFLSYKTYKK
jgi:hypothetical protein